MTTDSPLPSILARRATTKPSPFPSNDTNENIYNQHTKQISSLFNATYSIHQLFDCEASTKKRRDTQSNITAVVSKT